MRDARAVDADSSSVNFAGLKHGSNDWTIGTGPDNRIPDVSWSKDILQ